MTRALTAAFVNAAADVAHNLVSGAAANMPAATPPAPPAPIVLVVGQRVNFKTGGTWEVLKVDAEAVRFNRVKTDGTLASRKTTSVPTAELAARLAA